MICAAWLHDTVEDTPANLNDIEMMFGNDVMTLVEMLTDVSRPEDGNRRIRKQIDLNHTELASPRAQTIKLADLIDNSRTIIEFGKGFTPIYMNEKRRLMRVLMQGDPILFAEANLIVENYLLNNPGMVEK